MTTLGSREMVQWLRAYCFCGEPASDSQLHSGVSQPSVTIVPGDLTPSSGLPQVPALTWLLREIDVYLFKGYQGFIKLYAATDIKINLKNI